MTLIPNSFIIGTVNADLTHCTLSSNLIRKGIKIIPNFLLLEVIIQSLVYLAHESIDDRHVCQINKGSRTNLTVTTDRDIEYMYNAKYPQFLYLSLRQEEWSIGSPPSVITIFKKKGEGQ